MTVRWTLAMFPTPTPQPTSCRLWQGSTNSGGYGQPSVGGRRQLVHRRMYEMAYGPIPTGAVVRHRCDQPLCYRIEHLVVGSRQDNVDDMTSRQRQAVGARIVHTRLDAVDVVEIKRRLAVGESGASIARAFGVSDCAVFKIRDGITWKHVPWRQS